MHKKSFWTLLMFFVMFFISINKVEATAFKCVYGIDSGSGWEKKLTFSIDDVNGFKNEHIEEPDSPIISDFYIVDFESVDNEDYNYIGYDDDSIFTVKDKFEFYVSLYPNKKAYNMLMERSGKERCPSVLHYTIRSEVGAFHNAWQYYIKIFNDSLDEPDEHFSWWRRKTGELDADIKNKFSVSFDPEGYFVEESVKDKKLEDLVDNRDCMTYSYAIQGIRTAAESNETGCDNNIEFNKIYSEIELMCENYRATALYAEDSNSSVVAKSCSKACSMLKDDVAEICQVDATNGYCGSLGNKIVNWIFRMVRIVRYALPALLIILSILDYIKALASDSEDEMKKVTNRFVKRLIAAAIVFIVPFILDFVLNIFSIPGLNADNPFCAE